VLKEGQKGSEQLVGELKALVKKSTEPHKYPRTVVFVDELPKTATGKIQRYKLRQRAKAEAEG
jgi:acyl-coenzyme A synthetase/AMP-(fatty) acid ligase